MKFKIFKWIKTVFSKQAILFVWLPGIIISFSIGFFFFILGKSELINKIQKTIVIIAQSFFYIFTQTIPIWILMILALIIFILYRIKQKKLNEKQKFILSLIDNREVSLKNILGAYKRRWPKEERITTKCIAIIEKLEQLNYAELGCLVGGMKDIKKEMFRLTNKGKKRLMKKINDEVKNKAEEVFHCIYNEVQDGNEIRTIELLDEEKENFKDIIFLLQFFAEKEDLKELKSNIRNKYNRTFTNKETSDFNYNWSDLESRNFIIQDRGTTGYGGAYEELPFYITKKGLKFYNDNHYCPNVEF